MPRTAPPRLALVVLLLAALAGGPAARADGPRVIEITAHRFEFTPAEITLARGEPVRLRLTSQDVTHGFFSRELDIDEVIEAGKVTEVALTPKAAGRFLVICDHFCGAGHGNMKLVLVVR
jgi:cytochrome c oxidase subunit 2